MVVEEALMNQCRTCFVLTPESLLCGECVSSWDAFQDDPVASKDLPLDAMKAIAWAPDRSHAVRRVEEARFAARREGLLHAAVLLLEGSVLPDAGTVLDARLQAVIQILGAVKG